MRSFDGRVVAITGAGSGIGRALAVDLTHRGALLAISDVDPQGLAGTVDLVKAAGVREVRSDVVDVASRADVDAWAADVVGQLGRVNVIVNNAGVSLTGEVADLEPADMEWIVGINFWGVVHGTQAFLPHLIASGDGHVVNVSSLNGIMAQPEMSHYCASKFAVRGFTECLRMEMQAARHPVGVLSVHPGGIKTNISSAALQHAKDSGAEITAEHEARDRLYREKLLKMDPAEAAKVILKAVEADRGRVMVGGDAKALDVLVRAVPGLYGKVLNAATKRMLKG
jgi:NAD(P)-dependent dehydrogenase (short-subunit alcohol dehydrogenase family)